MADEPTWASILELLYQGQQQQIRRKEDAHDNTVICRDELCDELDLSYPEVDDALTFMEAAGLLKPESSRSANFTLTPQGFKVAHERVLEKDRHSREDKRLERQQTFEDRRVGWQEERELQRSKRQHDVNRAVAFLTLGLISITLIDTTVRTFVRMGVFDVAFVIILIGLFALFAFTLILYYFGLISPLSEDGDEMNFQRDY